MAKYVVEFTDTFGGEANYCWVRRYAIDPKTDSQRAIVRMAKKICGFTGDRCEVSDFGDSYWIRSLDRPVIAFVDWFDDTNPNHQELLEQMDSDLSLQC